MTSKGKESLHVAWSAAFFGDEVSQHSPFFPTKHILLILACLSRISPRLLPKYSLNAQFVLSKKARIHSESPMNQIRFMGILAFARLVTEERASLGARTDHLVQSVV